MRKTEKIKLGDKVRDKYSGFTGIAVARTEYINGCVQYTIVPEVDKEGKYVDEIAVDETSLEIISKPKRKSRKRETGGSTKKSPSMRGY